MKLDKVINDLRTALDGLIEKVDLITIEIDSREDKFYDKSDSYQYSPAGERYCEITEELQDLQMGIEDIVADIEIAIDALQDLDTKSLKVVKDVKDVKSKVLVS